MLDSGTTGNFISVRANVANIRPTSAPISAVIPNGDTIVSTHDCDIDWPFLPPQARKGHILPGLANISLISVVKLCDAGCTVIFEPTQCIIKYMGQTVITGIKCDRTKLWLIPLSPHDNKSCELPNLTPNQINAVYDTETKTEMVQYLHQCLLSPPKSTLLKAIKNDQLLGFPGLTEALVKKYLHPAPATIKGHMHRSRQNLGSTRKNPVLAPI